MRKAEFDIRSGPEAFFLRNLLIIFQTSVRENGFTLWLWGELSWDVTRSTCLFVRSLSEEQENCVTVVVATTHIYMDLTDQTENSVKFSFPIGASFGGFWLVDEWY